MSEAHPNTQNTYPEPEAVQYPDGGVAFEFANAGDTVTLGRESHYSYAQHFVTSQPASVAIVTTESGNRYGVGAGLIVNYDKGAAMEISDIPEITVGRPWQLPGYSSTPVESVQIDWKRGTNYPGARQEHAPNPFPSLRTKLMEIRGNNPQH